MAVCKVESLKIENEAEADDYLTDLFKAKQYQTMEEAVMRANKLIPNARIRDYFLSQAEKKLSGNHE